jgi:hypothetical protein
MQNSETEPFYKNIKRLSFKNAFRAAARAISTLHNRAEKRHFTQTSRMSAAKTAFQAHPGGA